MRARQCKLTFMKARDSDLPVYFKYWGKAARDGRGYHLLPYHCLDMAAVANSWLHLNKVVRHRFSSDTQSWEQYRAWLLFL